MREEATTLSRRARPGGRMGDATPAPGNCTGEGRGRRPRAGLCAHFSDGEAEARGAQPCAGAVGAALPR